MPQLAGGNTLHAVTRNAAPVTRCIVANSTPVAVSCATDRGALAETTATKAAATTTARTHRRERRAARASRPAPTANARSVVRTIMTMPTWVMKALETMKDTSAARPAAHSAAFTIAAAAAPAADAGSSERPWTAVPSPFALAVDVVLIDSSRIREGPDCRRARIARGAGPAMMSLSPSLRDGVRISSTTRQAHGM